MKNADESALNSMTDFTAAPGSLPPQNLIAAAGDDFPAPGAPGIVNIDEMDDDIGVKQGNIGDFGLTDDLTPTLRGNLEGGEGLVLRVYANTLFLGTAVVDNDGSWSFTPQEQQLESNGKYSFEVLLPDPLSSKILVSQPYTIITTAPDQDAASAVNIPEIKAVWDDVGAQQGPIHNGDATDDARPTLLGTADAGAIVTVYDNGAAIGSTAADANGNWTFTPADPLENGEHSLTVSAADAAGNQSSPSPAFNVTTAVDAPVSGRETFIGDDLLQYDPINNVYGGDGLTVTPSGGTLSHVDGTADHFPGLTLTNPTATDGYLQITMNNPTTEINFGISGLQNDDSSSRVVIKDPLGNVLYDQQVAANGDASLIDGHYADFTFTAPEDESIASVQVYADSSDGKSVVLDSLTYQYQETQAVKEVNDFLFAISRGGDKQVDGLQSLSIDDAARNLNRDSVGWAVMKGTPAGETTVVTYKFLPGDGDTFVELDDNSKHEYLQQLNRVSAVANVQFVEVTGNAAADITVDVEPDLDGGGKTTLPLPLIGARTDYQMQVSTPPTTYQQTVYIHELDHALGLAHPGDYNYGGTEESMTYAEDLLSYTVMSYNQQGEYTDNTGYSVGPLMDDIAALQLLYGKNMTTNSGDTVYGFHATADDPQFHIADGTAQITQPFTIWDSGGNDTLDLSGFAQDQHISLIDGTLSDAGGRDNSVGIAQGAVIENAIGGSGNDILVGNDVSNVLHGGAGNDILYGGKGGDMLWGDAGADTFLYKSVDDSTPQDPDTIEDFTSGEDKIDLSAIFTGLNLSHTLNFTDQFNGHAGDTLLSYDQSNNQSSLAIDFAGSGAANFLIDIVGHVAASDLVVG